MKSQEWLPTSIKVLRKQNNEREKQLSNYEKAEKLTRDLRQKFNCAIAEIPTNKITDKEREKLIKAYILLGYNKDYAIALSK